MSPSGQSAVVWLACACLIAGCDDATGPRQVPNTPIASPPAVTTVDPALLAGDALAALGPDGRFSRSAVPLPSAYPQLSRQQGESLAVAFWRVFRGSYGPGTEEERGGPINIAQLAPCAPAQYAESSVEAAPDSASQSLRTHWGPRWVVVFCDGATQVLVIAVGTFATALVGPPADPWRFSDTELLTAAISTQGIPVGVRYPLDAEEAAYRIATITGRHVDSVPRLIIAKPNFSPWWTLWSVSLEHPVMVRGVDTGRDRSRQAVWFGLLPASRWLLTIADPKSPIDEGSFLTRDWIHRPDGTLSEFPIVLARRPIPAFGASEPVVVL